MKGFQWCDFEFDEGIFPDAKAQIATMKEKRGLKVFAHLTFLDRGGRR